MKGPNVAFANALASDETGRQDWRVTIKIWPHHRFVLPGLFAFVFSLSCNADAQGPAPSPLFSPAPVSSALSAPEPSGVHDLTKADLETFLDGLLPAQLQSRDIAGAVVAVVKDGQVLLAKGYGYADFAAKKPVVADQTLFRPGSISKVFTATAVLQLVEQGKLDLDRDVNDYLDFLASGGSTRPDELVKRIGMDITNPSFWDSGLNILDGMVSEVERLAG